MKTIPKHIERKGLTANGIQTTNTTLTLQLLNEVYY